MLEEQQDKFPIGTNVNVTALPDDDFHDFTGHVWGYDGEYIIVKDQEDEEFYTLPSQLEYSSDDIMHGE